MAGNAIHLDQSSGDVTIRAIDNSTMEQLLVLNNEGGLYNREQEKFVVADSDKVVSKMDPTTKWEIGIFIVQFLLKWSI